MSDVHRRFARTYARRAAVVCALAVGGLASSAGSALAAPPDPQTTNVPYLAWRGEQIRLVECSNEIGSGQNAQAIVESWSGNDPTKSRPNVEENTVDFFEG